MVKRKRKAQRSRKKRARAIKPAANGPVPIRPQVTVTYCTAAQVKDALTAKATYDELGYASDALYIAAIEAVIVEAEKMMDNHCHRTFAQVTGATEIFDGEGQTVYSPKWTPIISVSKLEERGSKDDAWSEIDDADWFGYDHYVQYPDRFSVGNQNYRLTYSYGYATVPKDIEQVCVTLVANSFIQRRMNAYGGVVKTGDYRILAPVHPVITPEIETMLRPYVRKFIA